jgi:hypothetical protein
MKKPDKSSPERELLRSFEAAGLIEYLEYLQSGKRVMMTNFKAGVAKGLGLTLGMSVVLGIFAWVLTLLVDLPVIGEYAGQIEDYMNEFRDSTNYTDEFYEMNELLRSIDENTSGPEAADSPENGTAASEATLGTEGSAQESPMPESPE